MHLFSKLLNPISNLTTKISPIQIKIAFITWKFPNWHNTFTFYQILELINLGFTVDIFSIERSEEKPQDLLKSKIYYFDDFISSFITAPFLKPAISTKDLLQPYSSSFGNTINAFPQLSEEIKKYDIIHAGFGNNPATAAMILSTLSGIPYTFESHAYDLYTDFKHADEKIRTAKKIFTISNYNKKYFINTHKCPPNKIDVKRITFNKKFLNQPPPSLKNQNMVVSVSRLHPIKALSQCIDAFNLSYHKNNNLRYKIIGDGDLKHQLNEKINSLGLKDVVTILGKVNQSELIDLLHNATLLLALSTINIDNDRDGIPTSLIEAMALGLPVISTRISGIPELIDNGLNGFLTEPDDIVDVSKKIDSLVSNSKLRKKFSINSKKKVLTKFNIEKNLLLMTKTWKKLAENNHGK